MKTFILFLVLTTCSVLIAAQMPPESEFAGTGRVVNGYELYPDFEFVLQPEYNCYGTPMGSYTFQKCKICTKSYVIQPFGKDGVKICDLYADAECTGNSATGYHNGLDLQEVDYCPCISIQLSDKEGK